MDTGFRKHPREKTAKFDSTELKIKLQDANWIRYPSSRSIESTILPPRTLASITQCHRAAATQTGW
jgi:hypothetical protein